MNNSSFVNETLINLLIDINIHCPVDQKISRLYYGIINNSILSYVTYYTNIVKISKNDIDSIIHHGTTSYNVQSKYKNHRKNLAVALITLRKILPYSLAKFSTANSKTMSNDALHHAINHFKFKCNSDFYTLFDFTK